MTKICNWEHETQMKDTLVSNLLTSKTPCSRVTRSGKVPSLEGLDTSKDVFAASNPNPPPLIKSYVIPSMGDRRVRSSLGWWAGRGFFAGNCPLQVRRGYFSVRPRVVKWQAFISGYVILVAYLQTQSLLPLTKIKLKTLPKTISPTVYCPRCLLSRGTPTTVYPL